MTTATRGAAIAPGQGRSLRRTAPLALLPVLVGFLAVEGYGPVLRAAVADAPGLVTPAVIALAFLCAACAPLRYAAEAGPARLLTAGLGVAAGLYALALGPEVAVAAAPPNEARAAAIGPGLGIAVLLAAPMGLLGLWRPGFAAFPFVAIALHKEMTRAVSGATHLGSSDYLPLVEVGLFLAVGLCALALARRLVGRAENGRAEALDAEWAGSLLFAAAIGAHLGNYFMSGVAKVSLDGGALSWVLENPTASLMLAGYNLGTAPLSAFPALFDALHAAFGWVEAPVNAVTLLAQLLCALAFLHRRLLIGFALFFDLMHITIFALTGALFVTWIVLNTLIVASAARLPERGFPPSAMVVGVLVTLLGHQLFWNARLGWYDGRQVRHAYFTAIDAEGAEHRVPHSFFRDASYLLLGRQFGYLEHARPSAHAPTSSWGQIGIHVEPPEAYGLTNQEAMRRAKACAAPSPAPEAPPDYDAAEVAAFVRGQHARALAYRNAGRANRYDLYPHHHLAMPFLFRDFGALDPREIVAYRYVVETVCLDATPEGLDRRVLVRTPSERIPVDG